MKTVSVHTDTGVVTIDCWIGTGSVEETPDEFGIAHFLEHMMFKGTTRFAANELDAVVTGLGGEWNAGTSKDWTHYHVTVPAEHFETATDIIADMMQHATLDATEFAKERAVIMEEILRKKDSPAGAMFETLYDSVFINGGYKHPTLGTPQTVSAMTPEMMKAFYKRFYTPDNAVVVIAGDVDENQAQSALTRYFGAWEGQRPPKPTDNTLYNTTAEKTEMQMDVVENYQALAWPSPPVKNQKEMLALDIAADILSGGRSSRLDRKLKEELGLVGGISCGASSQFYPSFFYLYTVHEPINELAAKTEAIKLLKEFAQNGPTEAEMARSRRKLRNELYFAMEETEEITSMVGYWVTLTGSTELVDNYEALIGELTPTDIRDAVATLLKHQYITVCIKSKKD